MEVQRENPFDVGFKYGAVGRGIGNAISQYQNQKAEEKGTAELDRIMQEYNNPQSTTFAGMTPSGRAYKMARLTSQIDPEASKRYEQLSVSLKTKEQEQGINKGIADAYRNSTGDKYADANAKLMETDAKSAIDNLEAQKNKKPDSTPEGERYKIQSAMNQLGNTITNQETKTGYTNDPAYIDNINLLSNMRKQVALQNPSLQQAYVDTFGDDGSKAINNVGATNVKTSEGMYQNHLNDIDNAKDLATLDSIKKDISGKVSLERITPEQLKSIESALAEKKKKLTPKSAETDDQVVDRVAKNIGLAPLGLTQTQWKLFAAGITNLGQGNPGTAIQNFIKTSNPNESVMADDINMANKGTISGALNGILGKFGIDASNATAQQTAEKLRVTAQNAIENSIASLDTYGMTPKQKELFILRKLSGKSILDYLNGNGKSKSKDTTKQSKSDPMGIR